MSTCRFVASTEPRILSRRHADPCTCDGEYGCQPCPEPHCLTCGRNHANVTCTECLEAARSDLGAIGSLSTGLPLEVAQSGLQSPAMALVGPAADPQKWHRAAAAAFLGHNCRCAERRQPCPRLTGRTCPDQAYLDDCRDELHPLWVLGTWEQLWREHLDHHTDQPITIPGAVAYLAMQLGYMADQADPPFVEFARDLRQCRGHLEDVLRDGDRPEHGAPCLQCGRPLTLIRGGYNQDDHWECFTCRRTLTDDDYRRAVYAAHQAMADRLTADALSERIGVKASVIRVWGSRNQVRKRGRDQHGITLYDVADAIARRDASGQQAG